MLFDEHLAPLRGQLRCHPIYAVVATMDDVRIFMQAHIFAVWDFMSLAKRLQAELTCTTLPWFTPPDAQSARFINEIILAEESDIGFDGRAVSHFEMYRHAMDDIGASQALFQRFLQCFYATRNIPAALESARVPRYIAAFVSHTLDTAINGSLEEVASSFLFGREDAIPEMFASLLKSWSIEEHQVPKLVHYLKRHIELDGNDHGPAATRFLTNLIGDAQCKERALIAASNALKARIALWDGITADISANAGARAVCGSAMNSR
jgi:hypothetical protein